MSDKKFLDKIFSLFNINIKKNAKEPIDKIEILQKHVTYDKAQNILQDTNISQLFKYWMESCHDSLHSWQNRNDLYSDIDSLYYNCSQISKAVEIITDEIIQADNNNQVIFVEADSKLKKKIEDLFDIININELIRPTIHDLVLYGNAFWVINYGENGINNIKVISPKYVKNRLEFTPSDLYTEMTKNNGLVSSFVNSIDVIQKLVDSILNDKDISPYFDEYLLGFEIQDLIVPAWKCLHFRNYTNSDPFKPFGTPLYVHAIAPYRQYDAAMSLQMSARGIMFPKEVYKLNLPNITSPTEKMEQALIFMRELLNMGKNNARDLPGLGDIIVTIEDLVSYEQFTPNIELGKIDDIELLKDDIYDATMLPRKLIDPKDSSFGESGVAFREQFKPFARLIYRFQSIFLQQLIEMIKLHLIHTGEFDYDDIKFTISMPYPESQVNNDIISSQTSLLDLANDIIGALEDKITGGEKLPIEVMKSIYHKFLPYDSSLIDFWINETLKQQENNKDNSESDDEDLNFESINNKRKKVWKIIENKYGKKQLKEAIDSIVLEIMWSKAKDMAINGRHVYSSKNFNNNFNLEKYYNLLKEISKNYVLKDSIDYENKEKIAEQFYEYRFSLDDDISIKEKKRGRKKSVKK